MTNLLRLMSLVPEVRTFLEHGDIEMGHARALLGLKEDLQAEAARSVIGRGLNVRYVGATQAERARVTDTFYANWIPGERDWHAGDVISEFEVTVRCVGD